MKLLDFYRDILKLTSATVDDVGQVSITVGGHSKPYLIDGKRLVIPTNEQLASANWKDRIAFHPLAENVLRVGESKVMNQYRRDINSFMNSVIGRLGAQFMALAVNVDAHHRLTPDQTPVLKQLADADERCEQVYLKIMESMGLGNPTTSFINLYLKSPAMVGGKQYNRGCIVGFPLREALLDESNKQVFGVTVTKKQRATLLALMDFLLPSHMQYNTGSYSAIAPSLHALLGSVLTVGSHINAVIDGYEDFITGAEQLRYPADWVEVWQDLTVLTDELNMLRMLPGNEGVTAKEQAQAQAPVAPVQQTASLRMPMAAPASAPHAAAPAVPSDGIVRLPDGSIDMVATQRARMGGMAPGMMPGMPMGMPGMMMPGMMPMVQQPTAAMNRAMPPKWHNGTTAPQPGMMMPGGYWPGTGML